MGGFAVLVSELKKSRCPRLEGYRAASGRTSIHQWFSKLPAYGSLVELLQTWTECSPSVAWLGICEQRDCDKLSGRVRRQTVPSDIVH